MNERTVLNFIGQIIDTTETLKRQPPGQRHAHADRIAGLARAIKKEVLADANTDENPRR